MIFNEQTISIPDGENITLFAMSKDVMALYIYKNGLKKKLLKLGNIVRCQSQDSTFFGEYIKQISSQHLCLCYGSNLSIVKND